MKMDNLNKGESYVQEEKSHSGGDALPVNEIRDMNLGLDGGERTFEVINMAKKNVVLDDENRFISNNELVSTDVVVKNENGGKNCGMMSVTRGEMEFNDDMIAGSEKVVGNGILRPSNLKIITTVCKPRDLKAMSKQYHLSDNAYTKAVASQGYAQMLRDSSMAQKSTPIANIIYRYHDVPTSARLILKDEVCGLKIQDAIANVLSTKMNDRVHVSIREFVKSLERYRQFELESHVHRIESLVDTTDEPFCDTCAVRFFLKEYLDKIKIKLSPVMNESGLGFDTVTTMTICHGILVYGLLLCRTEETSVQWDKLAYAPHHIVSTLAKSFLAERLHLKYEPSSGCEMLKSTIPMELRHFQRRLLISCFIDFWRLVSYAVREVQVDDGTMILRIPRIYKRQVYDEDNSSKYRICQVSVPLLKRYASYKPNASIFTPVLKLFINGRDAMSQIGIYTEICRYMVAYYTALVREEFTSNVLDVISKNVKASEFILRGSFKVLGMNNGILLVEVIKRFDPQFGKVRHYDKYYNFCDEEGDAPLTLGESVVNRMSIMSLINPYLLSVLNEVVLDFLSTKVGYDGKMSLTWCFEYGGTAIFCHRGNFSISGGEEIKNVSENVMDICVTEDELDFNWAEEVNRAQKVVDEQNRALEESYKDKKSKIYDLLKRLLRVDAQYSINLLNHNIAVSVINNQIMEDYRKGMYAERSDIDDCVSVTGKQNTVVTRKDVSKGMMTINDFPLIVKSSGKKRKDAKKQNKKNEHKNSE